MSDLFKKEWSYSENKRSVCIVFEAGPTHDGLQTACKLVDVAVEAGADAIKFQTVDAKRLVPDPSTMFTYNALVNKDTGESVEVTESLQEILQRRELSRDEWRELGRYCSDRGILFFSTATTASELELLAEIGADCVKIASGDITYHHFLRLAAQYSWTVQIDTGNATIAEVEEAVDVLERSGCRRIIINHCPSGYPARLESINLRIITTLKQMFPYPVAFSDHTPGATMDIAAVALGADMIEKTITLDRLIRSPEHIMSLEPHEAAGFVQTIRDVETGLGTPRKIKTTQELSVPSVAKRSVIAAADIEPGTTIEQVHLDYARPGDGIPANLDRLLLGKRASSFVAKGTKISFSDVS
jgi:sialic acid synthase SpsE